jgi:uncharacterized membrane protein YhhN
VPATGRETIALTENTMTEKPGKRAVLILWFVAALLAFIAVAIRFGRDREMNWPVAGGGLFCLVMGLNALARNRGVPPTN